MKNTNQVFPETQPISWGAPNNNQSNVTTAPDLKKLQTLPAHRVDQALARGAVEENQKKRMERLGQTLTELKQNGMEMRDAIDSTTSAAILPTQSDLLIDEHLTKNDKHDDLSTLEQQSVANPSDVESLSKEQEAYIKKLENKWEQLNQKSSNSFSEESFLTRKTQSVLEMYTGGGWLSRVFKLQWNRHHISEVNPIIQQLKQSAINNANRTINLSPSQLALGNLQVILFKNPRGTLATTVKFLEKKIPAINQNQNATAVSSTSSVSASSSSSSASRPVTRSPSQ